MGNTISPTKATQISTIPAAKVGRRNNADTVTCRPGRYRANAGRRSGDQPQVLIGHFRQPRLAHESGSLWAGYRNTQSGTLTN